MPISKNNVIFVVFRGGVEGDGKPVHESNAGTAGKIVAEVRQRALLLGMQFSWVILEPGVTSQAAVATAIGFIKKYATPDSRLIVYGYSRGGDAAVDLSRSLQSRQQPVDLLITIDAAYGPMSDPIPLPVFGAPGSPPPIIYTGQPMLEAVNRKIPANVALNLNYYQTEPSGPSSASRAGQASGSGSSNEGRSSHSNSGKSDSVGSHGAPNTAVSSGTTRVFNQQVQSTSHAEIDEKTKQAVILQISAFLRSNSNGKRWSPMPTASTGM